MDEEIPFFVFVSLFVMDIYRMAWAKTLSEMCLWDRDRGEKRERRKKKKTIVGTPDSWINSSIPFSGPLDDQHGKKG